MKRFAVVMTMALLTFVLGIARAEDLVLVEKGVGKIPIVVPKNVPLATVNAGKELSDYIEKISGARLDVVRELPDPIPESAIWVGFQECLTGLLPDVKFDFENPEEILFACNGKHLVICGRDRMVSGVQVEHGTANAVYAFLQQYLDVRWLWPGPSGEDLVTRDTIELSPFEYRFHPQLRQRDIIMHWVYRWYEFDRKKRSQIIDWNRRQGLMLDSLEMDAGHAFTDWWQKYHEEHPDYFALQPDGTRSDYPAHYTVKLCQSNPKVWERWLDNVVEVLKADPSLQTFNASPNDWFNSGICVCEKCRALDDPDGPEWTYSYADDVTEKYVAMTQRYVTFWNHLAQGLKERFPNRKLFAVGFAYGPAMPPPRKAVLDDNIIIGYVGHFPLIDDVEAQKQKSQWAEWSKKAGVMIYRPNLWYFGGGGWGFPEVALKKTIEDFRFLGENRCAGIVVDMNRSFWATHGPEYYLMARLAWDPHQDGYAVLDDYYERGFGPAAGAIARYWEMMEEAQDAIVNDPNFVPKNRERFKLPPIFERVYSDDFLTKADALLTEAATKVAEGPEKYAKRVAFVRSGFDVMNLMARVLPIMTKVRESEGKDVEAVKQAVANWEEIKRICDEAGPIAIRYDNTGIHFWLVENGYMGGMQDYFGPPSEEFRKAAGIE